MQTYFPSIRVQRLLRVQCLYGERVRIGIDYRGLGTVISSEWTGGGGTVDLSDVGLSTSVADVLITASQTGRVIVQNNVAFSDGQAIRQQVEVEVREALIGATAASEHVEYLELMSGDLFELFSGGGLELESVS